MVLPIKRLESLLVRHSLVWRLVDVCLGLPYRTFIWRRQKAFADTICEELRVKNGPFAGMQYPSRTSFGSSLIPKLLGSYEQELHSWMDRICRTPYDQILDIGCAEGYYAVGLALRIPRAQVVAFDIDEAALTACQAMACLNRVSDRVRTSSNCTQEVLTGLLGQSRSLVISDCEGYERELFTSQSLPALRDSDLLIEAHDFLDPSITASLTRLFADTHSCERISSIPDSDKGKLYSYSELANADLDTRRYLLAEWRPQMHWLFFQSNLHLSQSSPS